MCAFRVQPNHRRVGFASILKVNALPSTFSVYLSQSSCPVWTSYQLENATLGRSSALTASPDNSFPPPPRHTQQRSQKKPTSKHTSCSSYPTPTFPLEDSLHHPDLNHSTHMASYTMLDQLHLHQPPPSLRLLRQPNTPDSPVTSPTFIRNPVLRSFNASFLFRSSFPFLARAHACVEAYLTAGVRARADRGRVRKLELPEERIAADEGFEEAEKVRLEACLKAISHLDYSYHTLLLNHVARRASKAQGIALLTLYAKAFAKPINLEKEAFGGATTSPHSPDTASPNTAAGSESDEKSRIELAARLIDTLKLEIRRSTSTSTSTPSTSAKATQQNGHLPICWAVFSRVWESHYAKQCFCISSCRLDRFFSSSIRLNTLGPYLAHQIMRFQMRGVVEDVIREMEREGRLTVESGAKKEGNGDRERDEMRLIRLQRRRGGSLYRRRANTGSERRS